MTTFRFTDHTYGCVANGCLVLLDLQKDEYLLLSQDEWQSIRPFIDGEFVSNGATAPSRPQGTAKKLLDALREQGLITNEPNKGRPFFHPNYVSPDSPFEQIALDQKPEIKFHHCCSVILAGVVANIFLKALPMSAIVELIRRKKKQKFLSADLQSAKELAQVYDCLRPLMLKSRVCLYDSLAFLLFCWFYGVYPEIIFGVTGDPFSAHCWAQKEGVILNDVPQNITHYKPILVV